jgi:glycosyltransferase involved in cell wall biosynthesis
MNLRRDMIDGFLSPSKSGEEYLQARTTRPSAIAAIVPAYNEAQGIGKVLEVLSRVDLLRVIIVVDDGSIDSTAQEVQTAARCDPRIRLIRHSQNQGKGQAILTGWRATRAPILLTLDADLSGLQPGQVLDLIRPLLQNRADMTLGLFKHGSRSTDNSHRATPWLTGQRCFRADLLTYISFSAAAGYGFETALTVAARRQSWRVMKVALVGVSHPPSETHRGFWQGLRTRSRMYAQIIRAWYIATGWQQMVTRIKQLS